MNKSIFSLGDEVTWLATKKGEPYWIEGEVVACVPAGQVPPSRDTKDMCPSKIFEFEYQEYNTRYRAAQPRDHESYLIRVDSLSYWKPRLYWPKVKELYASSPCRVYKTIQSMTWAMTQELKKYAKDHGLPSNKRPWDGWKSRSCTEEELLGKLVNKLAKLEAIIDKVRKDRAQRKLVRIASAEIANISMMLADKFGSLPELKSNTR